MKKNPIIGISLDHETKETYSAFPWYALRENYSACVAKFGAAPILLPHLIESIPIYLDIIDGLILTGGDFDIHPKFYGEKITSAKVSTKDSRTNFEMELCKKSLEKQIPILGICAGHQLINVVQGGSLHQHIPDVIPNHLVHEQPAPKSIPSHLINVVEGSKLHKIVSQSSYKVNSTHHQAVNQVGKNLIISSKAPDGVIESIEHINHPFCIGVEWHPEYLACKEDELLIESFVEACKNGKG